MIANFMNLVQNAFQYAFQYLLGLIGLGKSDVYPRIDDLRY